MAVHGRRGDCWLESWPVVTKTMLVPAGDWYSAAICHIIEWLQKHMWFSLLGCLYMWLVLDWGQGHTVLFTSKAMRSMHCKNMYSLYFLYWFTFCWQSILGNNLLFTDKGEEGVHKRKEKREGWVSEKKCYGVVVWKNTTGTVAASTSIST